MENTAGPTIFKSPDLSQTASQIAKNPGGWFRRNLLKIVIVLLVVGVIAEIFFGASSLFFPSTSRQLNIFQPKVNEISKARLSLIAQRPSYKKNETVVVDVKLFTGGQTTDSTDLVVKYDPAFLRPISQNFVSVGQIYSEYPPVQIDNENGLIGISGITLPDSSNFSGVGNFARLNFTALKDGQTKLTIDFQENQTGDSNVVLSGSSSDILGGVDNVDITISEKASGDPKPLPQNCGSFTQSCQDASGKTGTASCNAGTMKDGSCSYDPWLTTSCEVCKI